MASDNVKNNNLQQNESLWIADSPQTNYPEAEDVTVDTAVIGGGIAGITAAALLKEEGQKVVVIEANRICMGTTAYSTSKVTLQHNLIYSKIAENMGMQKAEHYAKANIAAMQFISDRVSDKNIDCGYKKAPAYLYSSDERYAEKFEREADIVSKFGIKAYFTKNLSLPFTIYGALCFENQAQFNPRKYVLSIAEGIPGNGSYIFENSRAADIKGSEYYTVVTCTNKNIKASNVIIATHSPFYDGGGIYFSRIYSEKAYAIAVKTHDEFPDGLFLGLDEPPYSFRKQKNGNEELIIIVGERHKTGQGECTSKHYENMIKFAKETFNVEDIPYRWSAQDCMTMDGIPYIGRLTSDAPNIYVATGFNKWGITGGTAAALILRDMIMKKSNPYEDVFSPKRFDISGSAKNFFKENFDVAKHLIKGKLLPVPDDTEIEYDHAKVVEIDGKKVGAYKDNGGILHIVDTTCTHLGCELKWNDAEKTWDCPCHGSRFTYDGDVIESPAYISLNHLNDEKNKTDANVLNN